MTTPKLQIIKRLGQWIVQFQGVQIMGAASWLIASQWAYGWARGQSQVHGLIQDTLPSLAGHAMGFPIIRVVTAPPNANADK